MCQVDRGLYILASGFVFLIFMSVGIGLSLHLHGLCALLWLLFVIGCLVIVWVFCLI